MSLPRLHRRLSVLMGIAALGAFASSAGVEPIPATAAAGALLLALAWRPSPGTGRILERIWLVVAVLLAVRAADAALAGRGDVVIPVVDLLLFLLAAEALRPLESGSETRLHALAFALVLAATAYRPGLPFAVGFVAFVALATAALMVGHLRRRAPRRPGPGRRPGSGRQLAAATGVLTLAVLGASVVVFLAFPRVSRGWANRGRSTGVSVAGFSDVVSLADHGAEIVDNPRVALRVEFPDGRPEEVGSLRWRGRSYDHFDGVRWSDSRDLPLSAPRSTWYARRWPGPLRRTEIYARGIEARVLFALHPVVDVTAKPGIHPIVDNAGDLRYMGSGTPVYTAVSARRPPVEDLRRGSGTRSLSPSPYFYLQLPALPERIGALADSLAAGATGRYERVERIRRWFREEFTYTRELPAGPDEATLEHFLFRRRAGHCEYFSTGMAILLRSLGIPARNVNGFLGGDWNELGGYLAVTQNDAHSWVEAWFPGYGWVPFDPTPPGSGTGTADAVGFWPGRFLFDMLQHRWSKWVLDYDPEMQSGLFSRARRIAPGGERGGSSGETDLVPGVPGGWIALGGVLGVVLLLVSGRLLLGRLRRGEVPEVRLYLAARRAYEEAGFDVPDHLPPLAFSRRLRGVGAPGQAEARRLVRGYLRARFRGVDIGDEGRASMADDLRSLRRELKEARR